MMLVAAILVGAGVVLLAVSTLGLFVLPDFYTRAHAVAKSETVGLALVFLGLLLHPQVDVGAALRLVIVLVLALVANPTAVHALLRAAQRAGERPWTVVGGRPRDREGDQP